MQAFEDYQSGKLVDNKEVENFLPSFNAEIFPGCYKTIIYSFSLSCL